MVRFENKKLIIEMHCCSKPEEQIEDIQRALLYVLSSQETSLVNADKNAVLLDLLTEIMPTSDQIRINPTSK